TAGGEAWPLTQHPTAITAFHWAPDGKRIFFIAADVDPETLGKFKQSRHDPFLYEHNYQQRHLWQVEVASRLETRLTSGDFSVLGFSISGDSRRLVYSAAPTPLVSDEHRAELYVLNLSTLQPSPALTHNKVVEQGATFSPDGKQILFI